MKRLVPGLIAIALLCAVPSSAVASKAKKCKPVLYQDIGLSEKRTTCKVAQQIERAPAKGILAIYVLVGGVLVTILSWEHLQWWRTPKDQASGDTQRREAISPDEEIGTAAIPPG